MAEKDRLLTERLQELLTPAVSATGCDLEEVTSRMAGRRRLVTVLVDHDGGIDLDMVAQVSRAVSDILDTPEADALLEGAYVLEVSSPGVDRPLTLPRHWRRSVRRLVKITMNAGEELTARVIDVGVDADADDESVGLDVDGQTRRIRIADVRRAVVQVEFGKSAAGAKRGPDADADADADTDADDDQVDSVDEVS
jgi:ribosome maturation factor RimP